MGTTVNSDYQLRQYSLSTAYDITTATYDSVLWDWVSDGSQSGYADGHVFFGSSGTRLYLVRSANNVTEWISGSITAFSSTDIGKKVVGNSGSAIITSTAGAYKSVTAFADTSAISSWQLFGAEGKADGSGISLTASSAGGFDISGATYTGNTVNIRPILQTIGGNSASDGIYGAYLKNDGTMFYAQWYNKYMYQVPLTTAYDISSATSSGGAKSNIAMTQVSSVGDVYFKPDGTQFYVTDWNYGSDSVSQYNLSTAWDITTMSYGGEQTFTNSYLRTPYSVFFSADGTKMYTTQTNWSTGNPWFISRVTLSTAWDVTTASQTPDTNQSYNLTNNVSGSVTIYGNGQISPDGTKIVLANRSQSNPQQFILLTMSTPYDLSTISVSEQTVAQNTGSQPTSVITPDGLKVYMIGNSGTDTYEFDIGEAASVNYNSYSPALTNSSNGQINSSAWHDINSMAADETKNDGDIFYAVSTDNRTSWGVAKGSDGVRKIARNNSGTWQYNNAPGTTVSIGYDLANGSFTTLSSHLSQNEGYQYMHFKPDGTKVWVGGQTSDTIFEYDIGTAFDLSTVSYGRSKAFSISTQSRGFFFKPDGTRAYISDRNNYIRQLNMNTAWNISTAQTAYDEYNMNTTTSGIFFKSDGTKFYNIDDGTGRELKQFSMSTAWDITTASLDYTVNLPSDQGVSNQGVALAGNDIWFSSDGTYFFLPHNNTGNPVAANSHIDIRKGVAKFSLSTAWDISSTITYLENIEQVDQNGAHLNRSPSAVNFNSDGSKMYTIVSENSSTSPAQRIMEFSTGGTTTNYGTSETWVDGTHNNEHATLQEALGAQSFNRMDKAQLQAVTDPNHYVLGDTLDLMIAPYAASGTSPLSDGVTIGYQADALVKQAINGTDYEAEFPATNKVKIKSLAAQNLKIRII